MDAARVRRLAPALAWIAVLLAGWAFMLRWNLPGHMSVDTVISLAEGRSGVRIVFGPPMFSSLLGFFDRITPGLASAYVMFGSGLLVASLALLPAVRRRASWFGPLALAAAWVTPQFFIYQAIAWKDVLFANFAVAGFIALAFAVSRWEQRPVRVAGVALAFLCLGMACLLRQNGALVALFSAATLMWAAWGGRWRSRIGWGVLGFAAPLVLAALLNAATPVKDPPGVKRDVGLRLLQGYDLSGALADDPDRPLKTLEARNPRAAAEFRREAQKFYSPTRIDALLGSKTLGRAINSYNAATIGKQWREMILEDPAGYAQRRLEVFRWVFATPKIDLCLPVHLGVDGPPNLMKDLGLERRQDARDGKLFNYVTWWLDTPGLSHVAYAVVALGVAAFLLVRRERADIAMAGLMLSALSFAASFFVISLACDYRYLYFLDLAALTGLVYVALDPRLRRTAA